MIAAFRNQSLLLGLFQPFPLKDRRFIKSRRRVRIVLKKFCWPIAAIGEVHPPVEIFFAIAPTVRDKVPKRFRDPKAAQHGFVGYGARHDLET